MQLKKQEISITDLLIYILILVAFTYTIRNLIVFSNIPFWRQDALYYYGDYINKLKYEGRWINHILAENLKRIPAIISITIHFICLGLFSYKCADNVSHNKKLSLMIALCAVNLTPLANQLLWPVTSLPAFVFIGIIPFIYNKMSKFKFLMLSSIIFFGTFSNYIFILPLIYLGELLESTKDKKVSEAFMFTLKELIIPWILCFVIGTIVANIITFVISGQFIELAQWRNPHIANSPSQFFINLKTVITYFARDLKILFSTFSIFLILPILILKIVSFKKDECMYILICCMVIMAAYLSTVFHGIAVLHRTVVPTFMGILFLLGLPSYKFVKGYMLNIILAFCMAISFSNVSYDSLTWYSTITNTYYDELQKGDVEMNPVYYNKVIVLIDDEEIEHFNNEIVQRTGISNRSGLTFLGSTYRTTTPALLEMGFTNISVNPKDYNYTKVYDSDDIFIKKVDDDNNLVIYFNHPAYDSSYDYTNE